MVVTTWQLVVSALRKHDCIYVCDLASSPHVPNIVHEGGLAPHPHRIPPLLAALGSESHEMHAWFDCHRSLLPVDLVEQLPDLPEHLTAAAPRHAGHLEVEALAPHLVVEFVLAAVEA